MRTGRSILTLQGHVQGILTMDFSPDGYHLATGSEDHSCRIWDLRKRGCTYVLPAHKSLIAQVSPKHIHKVRTFRVCTRQEVMLLTSRCCSLFVMIVMQLWCSIISSCCYLASDMGCTPMRLAHPALFPLLAICGTAVSRQHLSLYKAV